MFSFLRRKPPAEAFWNWFAKNSDALLAATDGNAAICRQLGAQIRKVYPGLTWELGPPDQQPRQFVISADGIREVAFAVEQLADAAPSLPGWRLVRFRPRVPDVNGFSIEMNNTKLAVEDIDFRLVPDPPLLGIDLYIPGLDTAPDPKPLQHAAFLLLDIVLGEYDMIATVGEINFHDFDAPSNTNDRQPMTELRATFDAEFERSLP